MPAGKAVAARIANAASKAVSKEPSKVAAAATKAPTKPKVRAPSKPQPVSPTLRHFLGGVAETTRTNTVKQLWDYIRKHGLQDPEDGKEVLCDDKLKAVLGKDRVNFKEILGLISPHFPKKEVKKS